ncbi:TIGR01906 family membrane protein [Enterococcus olivae]
MKVKGQWLERLGMLSLFLTIISLAIAVTINFRPLYAWDIDFLGILNYTSLSKEELLKNYELLLGFLNNPWNQTLALPDFPMSEAGAGHFYDVKKLFLLNYSILAVTVIPSGLFLYYCQKNQRFWRLIRPAQWAMAVPVLFGGLMVIGFDTFFVKFHELFFNNDDWLFNPVTDPIINVLPEQFFMHCFIFFFVLIEGLFLLMLLRGKRKLKRSSTK